MKQSEHTNEYIQNVRNSLFTTEELRAKYESYFNVKMPDLGKSRDIEYSLAEELIDNYLDD